MPHQTVTTIFEHSTFQVDSGIDNIAGIINNNAAFSFTNAMLSLHESNSLIASIHDLQSSDNMIATSRQYAGRLLFSAMPLF